MTSILRDLAIGIIGAVLYELLRRAWLLVWRRVYNPELEVSTDIAWQINRTPVQFQIKVMNPLRRPVYQLDAHLRLFLPGKPRIEIPFANLPVLELASRNRRDPNKGATWYTITEDLATLLTTPDSFLMFTVAYSIDLETGRQAFAKRRYTYAKLLQGHFNPGDTTVTPYASPQSQA